jgi:hypothetical protein
MCSDCEEELRREPLTALRAISEVRIQRVCSENEEEEQTLRPDATGGDSGPTGPALESRVASLRGRGAPLSPAQRGFFEPRFGHDLSGVRLHTGTAAADAARLARARAFTVGRDIAFGAGEFHPEGRSGRRLLAHELTHVVQQTPLVARRKPLVQRQPVADGSLAPREPAAETPGPAPEQEPELAGPEQTAQDQVQVPGLLVEDEAVDLESGQMKKSAFMTEVRAAASRSADAAFAGTEHTTAGCPYIELALRFYERRSAERIEQDLLRYAPEAAGATSARDYVPIIAERVRQSAETYVETGEITGIPDGLPSGLGLLAGGFSMLGGLFFKARNGGPKGSADPQAVQAQLGAGRPLAGSVRSRMQSAFGRGFSGVRVHTGATASRLSNRLNARAFTVGNHVAFGAGEYRPGTPVGDALIAHELAHVEQQRGASDSVASLQAEPGAAGALERDADRSAAGVVASLWGRARGSVAKVARNAIPSLRSGLRLQQCSASRKVRGLPGMGIAPPLPPSVETRTYSLSEYITLWEEAAGRRMTDGEKDRLAKGCIGITLLNLGGNYSLSECYDTFEQAKTRASELEVQTRRRQFFFSKRFWSMGRAYTPDPSTGRVDMSGYTGATPPGEVNFDYGWYDEVNDTWWHANHCDPVIAGGTCADAYDATKRMKVYQSTLTHYSDPNYFEADVQVFCVAWSALQ